MILDDLRFLLIDVARGVPGFVDGLAKYPAVLPKCASMPNRQESEEPLAI
jgi:hypothetical protein